MFYVIETSYIGPNRNQDEYIDADRIEICTEPAKTNSSHEVRTEGWCGTTNDYCVTAHGEYDTLEKARDAVMDKFAPVRDSDILGYSFASGYDDAVAVFKPGKYQPMGKQFTEGEIYSWCEIEVSAVTSDDEISDMIGRCEKQMKDEGFILGDGAWEVATGYRNDKIRKLKETEDDEEE